MKAKRCGNLNIKKEAILEIKQTNFSIILLEIPLHT
jgi:hypothetical protein